MPDSYGSFMSKGYLVEAFMPANDNEPNVWTIRITKDDEVVREETVPLVHESLFGMDVEDIEALNERADAMLAELGE